MDASVYPLKLPEVRSVLFQYLLYIIVVVGGGVRVVCRPSEYIDDAKKSLSRTLVLHLGSVINGYWICKFDFEIQYSICHEALCVSGNIARMWKWVSKFQVVLLFYTRASRERSYEESSFHKTPIQLKCPPRLEVEHKRYLEFELKSLYAERALQYRVTYLRRQESIQAENCEP